jgi:isoleucyl-tRNA synthetase
MPYPLVDVAALAAGLPTPDGVSSSPRFPMLERAVLAFWADDDTFQASIDQRAAGHDGTNEFVFYDGPPFANGLPHYGHLLTGYVKDVVPRYQTMRGRRVERRFGWDCHGLPAELEAMRQLGITTKAQILELGVEKFNDACRAGVLKYTHEWQDYVTKQARWVDFEHDYKTLDLPYMESVMWGFKQLYDQGLVYEGRRVLPYCWNDETPLSSHELRMDDDVYQPRQDPAVTVGLRLDSGELALIWTTTPWTLPSNLAIAVNPDVDYVVVTGPADGPFAGERLLLAHARLGAYARELGDDVADRVVEHVTGAALVGRHYTPPFSYFLGRPNAHVLLAADYVTVDDGTGLVHIAPAFGEEDKVVADAAGIDLVVPVDAAGRFTAEVPDYQGQRVLDANADIVRDLRDATADDTIPTAAVAPGTKLLRRETYEHSYPHCWRCRRPLIYMAVSSWFVEVSRVRDRMVELNQEITWVPEHIKDGQFGKWLANARDWSISRNRFWGSPIPVWQTDDPRYPRTDVYGSLDELARDFGERPTDLHRPYIDELTRPNPDDPSGNATMRRVADVLDVWFDSGSMPFAQVHAPFENADWFEHHYPGDFIVEYIPQTRGWFYTLHVLATAIFDRPAFRTAIAHGTVLGDDGRKMSKSLRNYPDVNEVFDRDGSDAMRWLLMASPVLRGGNLVVTEQAIRDGVRQVLIPLWNTWHFFALYANASNGGDGYLAQSRADSPALLDRYLLAKTDALVADVTARMEANEIDGACEAVREHVDVLTNWYVRRSRQRFWDEDTVAFDVLYTSLETLCRVAAPLLPLTTETIWKGLTGRRSVHLTDWPAASTATAAATLDEADLVTRMDRVRVISSAALGLRKARQLRVRLPLAALTVVDDRPGLGADGLTDELASILRDEVNVRSVSKLTLAEAEAGLAIRRRLAVNAKVAGPRLGRDVQTVIRASKSGDWSVGTDGAVVAGGVPLLAGEFDLVVELETDDASAGAVASLPGGGFVLLDTRVTAELAAEGLARDVIRLVQQARRDAGLHVSDRIELTVVGGDLVHAALQAHAALLADETLAVGVTLVDLATVDAAHRESAVNVGDAQPALVSVTKA